MSRETLNLVKQRMSYHFKNVDGTYNVPKELPFMKEFFKEIDKLIQEHEDTLKLFDNSSVAELLNEPSDVYRNLEWFTERIGQYVWSIKSKLAFYISDGRGASDLWSSQQSSKQTYCDFPDAYGDKYDPMIKSPQWFVERIGSYMWSISGSHKSYVIDKRDVESYLEFQCAGYRFRDIEPTDKL